MQVNVIINQRTSSDDKKMTTTISYVNPQAANNKLLALAQAMNALTTNRFISATKEVKGEVL